MTFIAQSDPDPLVPEEATGGDDLWCVECAEDLSIVESHTREDSTFVSRHFRHPPTDSCGGGESDTHKAMKSIALSKMKKVYGDHAHATLEQTVGDRQADAYLRFSEPHETLGYGVIAEAQYKHDDKDEKAVTQDYLDYGYSIYWLYEDDYEGSDVELGEPIRVWPDGGPEYHPREISEIQTPTRQFPIHEPVLYTAGAIDVPDPEHTKWRRTVEAEVGNATFAHPEDTELHHGTGTVGGCVAEDIAMLNDADGVVAYLSEPTQNGTLTELLHAVHTNKPTLTIVDPSLFDSHSRVGAGVHEIEEGEMDMASTGDIYWFTINYLAGDIPERRINRTGTDHNTIPVWGGVAGSSVWVGGEDDIPGIVQRWVREQQLPSKPDREHIAENGGFEGTTIWDKILEYDYERVPIRQYIEDSMLAEIYQRAESEVGR